MEYLLKLHVNSVSLATKVKKALLVEYELDASVYEIGILEYSDDKLVWLRVVPVTGDPTYLVAIGYDEGNGWSAKYRVYGQLTKYCPCCKIGRDFATEGTFCPVCGTKYQYQV